MTRPRTFRTLKVIVYFAPVERAVTRACRSAVLAHHDALLHQGITSHGGVVITERGEGDSFFALFARPSDAGDARPRRSHD